jgi:trk system potassium uptake protein TrkA
MFVLIVGGGKDGSHLAEMLLKEKGKHKITIIERSMPNYELLTKEIAGATIIRGDGCDPKVLEEAGVTKADVVAAVTHDDEDNLVISQLAKFEFHVPKIIARVNNPKNEWLFTKDMGVDVQISKAHIIGKIIEEEATLGDLVTLLKLRKGELALVEETLTEKSKVAGQKIGSLELPPDCILMAILRDKQVLIPKTEVVLQGGDEILALTSVASEEKLALLLAG